MRLSNSMAKNVKKIALLNLPVDENFGGHLQRYALMEVMRSFGVDIVHLNCRFPFYHRNAYKYIRCVVSESIRFAVKFLKGERTIHDIPYLRCFLHREPRTERFYQRYVKHTRAIYTKDDLTRYSDYDGYLVGSDQVWRAPMVPSYGIDTYFFDYLPVGKKRFAYGVSLGTNEKEYTDEEVTRLAPMYKVFEMVSVRERVAAGMFEGYGWTEPKAECVIDPTLLLDKEHYVRLVNAAYTEKSNGNMFCYVLDEDEEKKARIEQIAKERKLTPFYMTLKSNCPVEQWLRSFMDAEFVVTDSYHGFLFSLIFNKPFCLMHNQRRGNVRFESVLQMLKLKRNETEFDWRAINAALAAEKVKSMDYIKRICASL